jgi:hypothetical protein
MMGRLALAQTGTAPDDRGMSTNPPYGRGPARPGQPPSGPWQRPAPGSYPYGWYPYPPPPQAPYPQPQAPYPPPVPPYEAPPADRPVDAEPAPAAWPSADPAPAEPPPAQPSVQASPTEAGDEHEAAPAPAVDRGPVAAGAILASIGVFLLFGQLVTNAGLWIPLLLGLIFLGAFILRREYGFLVAGSIISGVGLGVILVDRVPGELSGAVLLLSVAAGFLAIWVVSALLRLPENHWWPLIPGGIVAVIGTIQLADADVFGALRWWPLVLIAAGALIVVNASRRSRHDGRAPRRGRHRT